MKSITVYCAHCLRPLRRELHRVEVRTETCIREPSLVRRSWPDGTIYLYIDSSEMQCSTEVMLP